MTAPSIPRTIRLAAWKKALRGAIALVVLMALGFGWLLSDRTVLQTGFHALLGSFYAWATIGSILSKRHIILTEHCFEVHESWGRWGRRWEDVERFHLVGVGLFGLLSTPSYQLKGMAEGWDSHLADGLPGSDGLFSGGWSLSPRKLVQLLETYRKHFAPLGAQEQQA